MGKIFAFLMKHFYMKSPLPHLNMFFFRSFTIRSRTTNETHPSPSVVYPLTVPAQWFHDRKQKSPPPERTNVVKKIFIL